MTSGFLNINKPQGMTSHDVVDRVRRLFPKVKAGHAGTLDPDATGVLIVALGPATRLIERIQDMHKTYRSVFLLGAESDTDDAAGNVEPNPNAQPPALEDIRDWCDRHTGEVMQAPPRVSAIQRGGRRAYALVRAGESFTLEPRPVYVHAITILGYEWPRISVEVRCGSGTYIRSLARDLGADLGCGGLVESLERTAIGPFDLASAIPLDRLDPQSAPIFPIETAVSGLPAVHLDAAGSADIRHGRATAIASDMTCSEGPAAVFDDQGRLIALGVIYDRRIQPKKVLADNA